MFAKFDVCAVGHVTRDVVRIGSAEREMPGGAAYYFSMALESLGANVALITKAAKRDLPGDLPESDIAIFHKESQETTTFENVYPGWPGF